MNDPINEFETQKRNNIAGLAEDKNVQALGHEFLLASSRYQYSYNFNWLGIPIIQLPTDIVSLQEIIWQVKPKLIIETGVAHGGSLIFYASMLALLNNGGRVLGIDIDIRAHNRARLSEHPLFSSIDLIEGSSIAESTLTQVQAYLPKDNRPVLVALDSNHTHEHVLRELELYSPFVSPGSYLVVLDTLIEQTPAEYLGERPWCPGNSPHTAVDAFLQQQDNFVLNTDIPARNVMSVAAHGYLQRVK